ncbi:hypothetical protein GLYMA_17G154851v4 [Glycine max]|nr:hypothetical protein GLYMA_17G154851v4 [Glycine max]KAH1118593.1 hypothetical protein GYH30_047385 [Glycine max]
MTWTCLLTFPSMAPLMLANVPLQSCSCQPYRYQHSRAYFDSNHFVNVMFN